MGSRSAMGRVSSTAAGGSKSENTTLSHMLQSCVLEFGMSAAPDAHCHSMNRVIHSSIYPMSPRPVILAALLVAAFPAAAQPVFESAVAPILRAHCLDCHNPSRRKGDLDLSTPVGLLKGSESGPVFKPGEPDHSLLFELVHRGEMPKKGPRLSDEQVKTIRQWIAGGARFRERPAVAERPPHQHDIIPIMLLRCNACHGPQLQRGGLVMNSRAAMLKGGRSGPAIVPGDPDASLAVQRIEKMLCPPKGQLLKYFVKRPTRSEIEKLRAWIAAGAPEEDIQPDVATHESDPLVTDEDRRHWAFQPLDARLVKAPGDGHPVDAFIARKLKANGLDFAPPATRLQLIRRAFLDLIGLPPSPEELERWRDHPASTWYAEMIDYLLASPRYGERWGRYWLDLAGYADSEGGVSSDPVRKVAWKYRDYVIDSFNRDKPYDRFLLEQIAGDELIDHENAPEITQEMVDNLVATGFLRMGIDQTGSRTMNFVTERIGVISDAITVLGSAVMGLTLECARCHSHKYDPIPIRDYYRLKATFQGAFDEHDWLTFKNRYLQVGTPEQRRLAESVNPPLLARIRKLETAVARAESELRLETLRLHYPDMSAADRKDALVALRRADNTRSLRQRQLVEKLLKAELLPDAQQPEAILKARADLARTKREITRLRRQLVPSLEIRALWDRGRPSPTYILQRGEAERPGRLVGPGVPAVLTDGRTPFEVRPPFPDGTPRTGRRLALARWLTRPDHPLTARVMVNRIWFHHFGRGLVSTLENFGRKGARPSHPELLDWLAQEFVRRDWSIKDMHRLLMLSRTYRQSSQVTPRQLERDPQNRLYSRMPLRRMDAEALRDSLLFVSGRLDNQPGGPPDPVSVDRDGQVSVEPTPGGNWRRSIYAQYRRTEIPTLLATFDYPEMGPNCVSRSVSVISPQSLLLLNNRRVRELAASFADRVHRRAGDNPRRQIEAAFLLALSRPPEADEMNAALDSLRDLRAASPDRPDLALETFCHTLLNSAAFLYID